MLCLAAGNKMSLSLCAEAPYFLCYTLFRIQQWKWQKSAYRQERTTPILGLCHGVFSDCFISRYILEHFLPTKWTLRSVYERIRCVKYQTKLNVIKK